MDSALVVEGLGRGHYPRQTICLAQHDSYREAKVLEVKW